MSKLREYGYGQSDNFVKSPPRVTKLIGTGALLLPDQLEAFGGRVLRDIGGHEPVCPNCGCRVLVELTVDIVHPVIGQGHGSYLGCPACPWASPMVMVNVPCTSKGLESH